MGKLLQILTLSMLLIGCFSVNVRGWEADYGTGVTEYGAGAVHIADGSFILVGEQYNPWPLSADIWLVGINANGDSLWSVTDEENLTQHAYAACPTPDGGVAVAGTHSYEYGGNYYTNVILRLYDETGTRLVDAYYPGQHFARPFDIMPALNGGYLIAGWIASSNDDESTRNLHVIRVDADGQHMWTGSYDNGGRDEAHAICQIPSGGFLVAGSAVGNGGVTHTCLLRIDATGAQLSMELVGPNSSAMAAETVPGEGVIVTGRTWDLPGGSDAYLLTLDSNLEPLWMRTYGSIQDDRAYALSPADDGGWLIAGTSNSYTGTLYYDAWAVRTDPAGNQLWFGSFGGVHDDEAVAVLPVDGGPLGQALLLTGSTRLWGTVNDNVFAVGMLDTPPSLLSVDLVPDDSTLAVPDSGGTVEFELFLTNHSQQPQTRYAWVTVTLPSGSVLEPLRLTPVSLPSLAQSHFTLAQDVPAAAPGGEYSYSVRLGWFPQPHAFDAFTITKQGPAHPDSAGPFPVPRMIE